MALVGVVRLTTDREQTKHLVAMTAFECIILAFLAAATADWNNDPGEWSFKGQLSVWMLNGVGVALAVNLVARLLLDQGILPRLLVRQKDGRMWVASPLSVLDRLALEVTPGVPIEVGLATRVRSGKLHRGLHVTVTLGPASRSVVLVALSNEPERIRDQVMEGLRALGVPTVRSQAPVAGLPALTGPAGPEGD